MVTPILARFSQMQRNVGRVHDHLHNRANPTVARAVRNDRDDGGGNVVNRHLGFVLPLVLQEPDTHQTGQVASRVKQIKSSQVVAHQVLVNVVAIPPSSRWPNPVVGDPDVVAHVSERAVEDQLASGVRKPSPKHRFGCF